jgi:hypothetical protein
MPGHRNTLRDAWRAPTVAPVIREREITAVKYSLQYLAGLFGPEVIPAEALERAKELRQVMHSLDVNEANNNVRQGKIHVRLIEQEGYIGSALAFRAAGPRPTPAVQPDPSDGWCQQIDNERELGNLEPRKRLVLLLHYAGYTLEEIAGQIGLSVRRVRQLKESGQKELRNILASEPGV